MAKLLRKVYSRIFWKNEDESKTTPLGKSNLNKEDEALEIIDQRVCDLSNDKAEVSEIQDSIIYYDIEPISGNITVRTRDGKQKVFYIYQLIPKLKDVKDQADRAEANAKIAKESADIASEVKPIAEEALKVLPEAIEVGNEAIDVGNKAIESAENIRDVEANVEAMVDKLLDEITGTFVGALTAKGTIPFESLPTEGNQPGEMYNISNDFTSDSRFLDGAGKDYKAGSNVYWTMGGKWDVLAAAINAKVLDTLGVVSDTTGKDILPVGLTMAQALNNGYPVNYGNVLRLHGSKSTGGAYGGAGELLLEWKNPSSSVGRLWYKSQRYENSTGDNSWSEWTQIIDTKNGGRMEGNLTMQALRLWDGLRERNVITAYDDGDGNIDYGSEVVITGAGNMFIGGGEAPSNFRNSLIAGTNPFGVSYGRSGENTYIISDSITHICSMYQTPANMTCVYLDAYTFSCVPEKRLQLGLSDRKWTNVWTDALCNYKIGGSSGSYWNSVIVIGGDGVSEVGKYIDFHNTNNTTNDFDFRFQVNVSGSISELYAVPGVVGTSRFLLKSTTNNILDLAIQNDTTGIRTGLSYNTNGTRGLWDSKKSWWSYLDINNNAYFKGTADRATVNSLNQTLSNNLECITSLYIDTAATAVIIQNGEMINSYLIFLKTVTKSSQAIYGQAVSLRGYTSAGVTGGSLYASSNTGWTLSTDGKSNVTIANGSANRILFCSVYKINGISESATGWS